MVLAKKKEVTKTPVVSLEEYMGNRLRVGRKVLGLTQSDIAKMCGISFQQVQKYESGKNQMSAHWILTFAKILKQNAMYSFDGYMGSYTDSSQPYRVPGFADDEEKFVFYNELAKDDTINLVLNFSRIKDASARKRILDLVESLGDVKSKK